jgi:DNA-binding transcriptional MocR family regulator
VFADGDKLPSTRSLAAELSVSRLTVDNAYAELAAKGLLQQRRGSGAYVCHLSPPPSHPHPRLHGEFPLDRFTTVTSRLDGYADIPLPPDTINFAAGIGSPKIFPLDEFRQILHSILRRIQLRRLLRLLSIARYTQPHSIRTRYSYSARATVDNQWFATRHQSDQPITAGPR